MKITTQKLLLFLSLDLDEVVGYDHLAYLWPELSASGRRSLIAKLYGQGLIKKTVVGSTLSLTLTKYGHEMVLTEFPFLREGGEEALSPYYLLLLQPPTQDPYFRRLRARLKEAKLIPLVPAIYWSPGKLSPELDNLLRRKYYPNVALFRGGEWEIGDMQLFLSGFFNFTELNLVVSGISNQICGLTDRKIVYSSSNHQAKMTIFSVYDRIFALFKEWQSAPVRPEISSTSGKLLLKQFAQLF